jgi:hypothetical protein
MQDVRIDRLFLALRGRIFQGMKKALYQVPTPEELYALEMRARRERARYVAALFASLYDRVVSALTARKAIRHA